MPPDPDNQHEPNEGDLAAFKAGAAADHDAQPQVWHVTFRDWEWGRARGKDNCPICAEPLGPPERGYPSGPAGS